MTDRAALLAAVLADPADDTPRLVFADWLDETGDPADAARAAFIRAEIAAEQYPLGSPERAPFDRQAQWQFDAYSRVWADVELPRWFEFEWHRRYRRGFIEDVELPIEAFVAHAAELFAVVPVTTLRLTLPYDERGVRGGGRHLDESRRLVPTTTLLSSPSSESGLPAPLYVFGQRPELARLTSLHLGTFTLTDAGGLAEPTLFEDLLSCQTLTRLRMLILDSNPLDAAWLMAFTARLPGAAIGGKLEALSLADCQLTDRAAAVLLAARGLERVTWLNLSGNPISPATVAVLRERFAEVLV